MTLYNHDDNSLSLLLSHISISFLISLLLSNLLLYQIFVIVILVSVVLDLLVVAVVVDYVHVHVLYHLPITKIKHIKTKVRGYITFVGHIFRKSVYQLYHISIVSCICVHTIIYILSPKPLKILQ